MNSSLVSIVMPSFNQAGFIEASVRSVLEQDYQPLELLVADGGSTDGTLQRLEVLLAEYGPRLRWVSERDSGPANAVNKALNLVRGDVIGWLNSDDLYSPLAVSRAVRYLESRPDMLMVYGEGKHIDENSNALGRYPTRPLNTPIEAFQDGCFICQPTVFFRREFFENVGYLDESLKTSFDFDLWLRAYKSFPRRIGYIDAVQAYSRLHDDCITQKMRRLVAIEGIRVLAKYVGKPSTRWLRTYTDELCSVFPFGGVVDMRAEINGFVEEVKDCYEDGELEGVAATLFEDARLGISLPGGYANVYSDGWAPPVMALRIRRLSTEHSAIRLSCSHDSPVDGPISLRVATSWGADTNVLVEGRGDFEFLVDVLRGSINEDLVVKIWANFSFVPHELDANSDDVRRLSYKVRQLQWVS